MATSRPVTRSSSRRTFIPYASSPVRNTASITCSSKVPSGALSIIATLLSPSLFPQDHRRIHSARSIGGHEGGEHADSQESQGRRRESHRVRRVDAVEQGGQPPPEDYRGESSHHNPGANQRGAASHHLPEHARRRQPQGHADAVVALAAAHVV